MRKIICIGLLWVMAFSLTACIVPDPADADADKVAAAKDALTLAEETSADLVLPTALEDFDGVNITWVSSNEAVISNAGVVVRQDEDTEVTLTAKITLNTQSVIKEFTVNVLKEELPEEPADEWETRYAAAVVIGYTGSSDEFAALMLGKGGDKADEGNTELSTYELFNKYHKGYEGDETQFNEDLKSNAIEDMDGLVMQLGSVKEMQIRQDYAEDFNNRRNEEVEIILTVEDVFVKKCYGFYFEDSVAVILYVPKFIYPPNVPLPVVIDGIIFYIGYDPFIIWKDRVIYGVLKAYEEGIIKLSDLERINSIRPIV